MEDIHQMRVSIKKLKANWSLLEYLSGGKFSKKAHVKYISTIFDSAGIVREKQVNLSIIEKRKANYLRPFTIGLRKTQSRAIEKLLAKMKSFDLKQSEKLDLVWKQYLKGLTDEHIFNTSIAFILDELTKVDLLEQLLPDDQALHQIRIHLKMVYEILSILKEKEAVPELKRLQKNTKSINQQIGDWHDYMVLLGLLNRL